MQRDAHAATIADAKIAVAVLVDAAYQVATAMAQALAECPLEHQQKRPKNDKFSASTKKSIEKEILTAV